MEGGCMADFLKWTSKSSKSKVTVKLEQGTMGELVRQATPRIPKRGHSHSKTRTAAAGVRHSLPKMGAYPS